MRLTKKKVLALWRMRHDIFAREENAPIKNRFNAVQKLFEDIKSSPYSEADNIISIDGTEVRFNDGRLPSMAYFSCKEDDMTAGGAFEGVKIQADNFPACFHDIIIRIGCLLGGFDFGNHVMRDEFRIISNSVTGRGDSASLTSEGQIRHPSSHFADNNYFFNVVKTIQNIKDGTFNPSDSRIVLRWPNTTYYPNGDADAETSQKETLKYRFPYKFFYMWTHDVIHPVSLMAYRGLVHQQDSEVAYDKDKDVNQSYGDFETDWRTYSEKISNIIPIEERGDSFLPELSLLLSIIMIRDQSIVDMKELLDTGNKALILYGPPGTGKTYHAEELVCQELGIERADLEEYKFDADADLVNAKGAWTLVQFHPNYTYEDFIGGISPTLNENALSYTLKEGVFKRLCDCATKMENLEKKFIIVVDEINRADLSSVFGELMYGLEYRGRTMSIPNFKEKFVIPKNVYIIGTMNSIDKSLVTFDLALRRRFAFYKVMPQVSALDEMLANCDIEENCLSNFIARCKDLNEKISNQSSPLHLNNDYQIGHAYYGKIRDFLSNGNKNGQPQMITSFELEKLWTYHLYPLLEEYLGNRIEDDDVQNYVNKLMLNFTKDLDA